MSSGAKSCNINEMFRIFTLPHKYTMILASADKGRHGFSRGKTTPGVVILVGGRQPTCLVCLPSRRLSSVKNSEGLAGRSGATYARQRTQAYCRKSRTITQQMAFQPGPQACVPLSADATITEYDTLNRPELQPVSGAKISQRFERAFCGFPQEFQNRGILDFQTEKRYTKHNIMGDYPQQTHENW